MGFPLCHLVKNGNRVTEVVVVEKEDTWKHYENFHGRVSVRSSEESEDNKSIYNTASSAAGYLSGSSQSNYTFETIEDVLPDDIEKYIKQVKEK